MSSESANADTFVAIVFSAIAISSEGAELTHVLGAADYLSRLPPTADEFERAIQKLLGMRLVEEQTPHRFRLTSAGAEVWARTGEGGDIERYVRVSALLPAEASEPWTLNRAAFEAAEAAYHARMDAFMRRER